MSSSPGISASNSTSSSTSSTSSTMTSSTTSSTSSTTSSTSSTSSTTSTFTATSTFTSTFTPTTLPATTQVITSVVTRTPSGSSNTPTTVLITSVRSPSTSSVPVTGVTTITSTTTSATPLNTGDDGHKSSGFSGGRVVAVAVVIPVVVVALLVGLCIFGFRKRKQRKANKEARRKEVEDYGYNPNNDPTLPAVASDAGGFEMSDAQSSGYRGWGGTGTSNRKMSTTLSGGLTHAQTSEAGAYSTPGHSDGQSGDVLLNNGFRQDTMTGEVLAAGGAGGALEQQRSNHSGGNGVQRGGSNASSTYSHGNRSDASNERNNIGQAYDYNPNTNGGAGAGGYGYSQHGPYGDGTYGGGARDNSMPVVQDVSARRNTRIQQAGTYQQGNSGIAQNF